jgi:peroxiredoxin Q/BCP
MNINKLSIAFTGLSFVFLASLAMAIAPGDKISADLSAKNQIGKTVRIADFKGKYLLVYFYPKDETPGCTKEACDLRDQYAEIKKLNAGVVGVSRQDEKSHQQFIAKHKLPFDLLVDTDGSFGKAFGVESIMGTGFSKRQSVLIGPDGKVLRFYESVDPDKHAGIVLEDLKKFSAAH